MRAIQEDGGGRLTLISEDIDDIDEISFLCDIADVIKFGGEMMITSEQQGFSRGIIFKGKDKVFDIPVNMKLLKKRRRFREQISSNKPRASRKRKVNSIRKNSK